MRFTAEEEWNPPNIDRLLRTGDRDLDVLALAADGKHPAAGDLPTGTMAN